MKKGFMRLISILLILAMVLSTPMNSIKAEAATNAKFTYSNNVIQNKKNNITLYVKQSAKIKLTGISGKVKWKSSNKKVATVSKSGKIKAKKSGKTVITGIYGGRKISCMLTVKPCGLNSIKKTLYTGQTFTLKMINRKGVIQWSSSNNKSAIIVKKTGNSATVKATQAGSVTIVAKMKGKTYKCKLTIINNTSKNAVNKTVSTQKNNGNYLKCTYRENVIKDEVKNVKDYKVIPTANGYSVSIPTYELPANVQKNDVIILPGMNGEGDLIGVIKNISNYNTNTILELSEASMEDVFETFESQSTQQKVDVKNFVPAEGISKQEKNSSQPGTMSLGINKSSMQTNLAGDAVYFSLLIGEKGEVTDSEDASGIPVNISIEDINFNHEIHFNRSDLSKTSFQGSLSSEISVECKCEKSSEKFSKEILLGHCTVLVEAVSIDLIFYLVSEINGSMSIKYSASPEFHINVNTGSVINGKGSTLGDPSLEVDINGTLDAYIMMELRFRVGGSFKEDRKEFMCGVKVFAAALGFGIEGQVDIKARSTTSASAPVSCLDIGTSPYFKLKLRRDYGYIVDAIGCVADQFNADHFEIDETDITVNLEGLIAFFNDKFLVYNMHKENYRDGSSRKVTTCTFEKQPYLTEDFNINKTISSYKTSIKEVKFLDSYMKPSSVQASFDLSMNEDGTVMAYIKDNILYICNNTMNAQEIIAPKNLSELFSGFTAVTKIDVSNLKVGEVENMSYLFYNCRNLSQINFGSFDTSKVTTMYSMFENCSSLTNLDLSRFNTKNLYNMSRMFLGCTNLKTLNISTFKTSNVAYMKQTFASCGALTSLNLSSFDTQNVVSMESMFSGCSNLTSLDLSSFSTPKLTTMRSMFYICYSLQSLNVSNFDTSNVTDMYGTFYSCKSLSSLNLSNFSTPRLTTMSQMVSGCTNLQVLDLSHFNTLYVVNMEYLFNNCSKLRTVYVSPTIWTTKNVAKSAGIFVGCTSLAGGNGTKFSFQHMTIEYARVDKSGSPGYFTGKY